MRCIDFEVNLSDYIEGELNGHRARQMEQHALSCSVCDATLSGVLQVRLALSGLGDLNPPARFRLGLFGFLHENFARKRTLWARPLAVGLAMAAALAILLWPEQQEDSESLLAWETSVRHETLGLVWTEKFPEWRRQGPLSHAQVQPVSY